jgi:hypothetical protein
VQTITLTATGEFEDVTNSDSLDAAHDLNAQLTGPTSHGDSITVLRVGCQLDSGSNVPPVGSANVGVNVTSVPIYFSLQQRVQNGAESSLEETIRTAQTFTILRVLCSSYTSTGTFRTRKDTGGGSADGNLNVSVTGTGEFIDSTNSDAFSAGDVAAFQDNPSHVLNTHQVQSNISASRIEYFFSPTSGTVYFRPHNNAVTATEAETEVYAVATATLRNLFVRCSAFSDTRTIRTRKNGADGAVSVSVTGTGVFEDTTNSDSLDSGHRMAMQQSGGSAGNNGYIIAIEWDAAVAAVTSYPPRLIQARRRYATITKQRAIHKRR